jgi:hypothetical protein
MDKKKEIAITIRVPEDLHGKVVALAESEMRSLNGQFCYLIREGLRHLRKEPSTKRG